MSGSKPTFRSKAPQPRRPAAHAAPRSARRFLAGGLAIALLGLGCSVEKHYRVLSFFFDGVPDPAVLAASRSEVERVRAAGGTIYAHQPYTKEQCDACHRTPAGRMLTSVTASVCVNCHAGVAEQHRYMHGPVAVSACLWCHSPHESAHKSLLRVDASTLCLQCHDATLSRHRTIPAHADLTRSCIECHSGHGGSERYFLHAQASASQPLPATMAHPQAPSTPPEDTP